MITYRDLSASGESTVVENYVSESMLYAVCTSIDSARQHLVFEFVKIQFRIKKVGTRISIGVVVVN